jgi:DNA-binding MarR family transcriptional regulator
MPSSLPLSTLLAQTLVAFTIELDNEFEQRMPHVTTLGRKRGLPGEGPWLVSLVMWSNFMRYLGDDGIAVREFERQKGTTIDTLESSVAGMTRWGYVEIEPAAAGRSPKARLRDGVIRPTPAGRRATDIWRELPPLIEGRWGKRFGVPDLAALKGELHAVACAIDRPLPHYPPVRHQDMRVEQSDPGPGLPLGDTDVSTLDLSGLLSRVLLAFAIDHECESEISLAMGASALRILDGDDAIDLRELPRLSGLSKEAVNFVVKWLQNRRFIHVGHNPADTRVQLVSLTKRGVSAKSIYTTRPSMIEKEWRARFGAGVVDGLRGSLEPLVGDGTVAGSRFGGAITPPSDGWRSWVPIPETLPHYPIVLHRGGYPDGA